MNKEGFLINTASDAAEQVIRVSTDLGETAIKLVGSGAKELAALIFAALKPKEGQPPKITVGKQRLLKFLSLCRQENAFTDNFTINAEDQRAFQKLAKTKGLQYAAIADKAENKVTIICREHDIKDINYIFIKLGYGEVKHDPEKTIQLLDVDPLTLETQKDENVKKNKSQSEKELPKQKTGSKELKAIANSETKKDITDIPIKNVEVFEIAKSEKNNDQVFKPKVSVRDKIAAYKESSKLLKAANSLEHSIKKPAKRR